ncbi:MAG: SRPBCC family protein [Gemmatimonadaceae bacterium]
MSKRGKRWSRLATSAVIAGAAAPGVLRWVRRAGAARRAVDMRMTVVVERPIHDVFAFCHDFENFPEVMNIPLSITDSQDGRSHWAVRSPTGQTIQWDAMVTKYVPNSVIAWESVPDAPVYASGLMRFAPLSSAETRVDIALTYRPCDTALAEALRALLAPSNTDRLRSDLQDASHDLKRHPMPAAGALGPAA